VGNKQQRKMSLLNVSFTLDNLENDTNLSSSVYNTLETIKFLQYGQLGLLQQARTTAEQAAAVVNATASLMCDMMETYSSSTTGADPNGTLHGAGFCERPFNFSHTTFTTILFSVVVIILTIVTAGSLCLNSKICLL